MKAPARAPLFAVIFLVGSTKFSLVPPKGWDISQTKPGQSLSLSGPAGTQGGVPLLQFEQVSPNASDLLLKTYKGQKEYRVARQKWVRERGGRSFEFYPYEQVAGARTELFTTGFHYSLEGSEFSERVYYFRCGKKLMTVQSLQRSRDLSESDPPLAALLKSIECR